MFGTFPLNQRNSNPLRPPAPNPERIGAAGTLLIAIVALAAAAVHAADYRIDPNYSGAQGAPGGGYAGNYSSIVAALSDDSPVGVPAGASPAAPNRVILAPGLYNTAYETGRSLVNSKNNLVLLGATGDPDDVVITSTLYGPYEPTPGNPIGTYASASLHLAGNNVTAASITFANSTPTPYMVNVVGAAIDPQGNFVNSQPVTIQRQAVALRLSGDQQAFVNSKFLGYQDTLLVDGGRAYFKNAYVTGYVDYIFGQGTAVFEDSTINLDGSHSGGTITAANTDKRTSNGFVFLNSTITGESTRGNPVIDPDNAASPTGPPRNNMYLGRPYGFIQPQADSSTVWINTRMDDAIRSVGWLTWNDQQTNLLGDVRYAEFNSMDLDGNVLIIPGRRGDPPRGNLDGRVRWAHELTAEQAADYTVENIFSPESQFAWFGDGYDGSADPAAADYSWPAFWGNRSQDNGRGNALVKGNPLAYSNPTWTIPGPWDPRQQIAAAHIPEPATLPSALTGVAALVACGQRAARIRRPSR